MKVKVNKLADAALRECGLPYEISNGGKHYHVRICGQMVAILPKGGNSRARCGRSDIKTASDIRKKAAAIRAGMAK